MATLKEIQAKLLEQEAKKDRSKSGQYTGDNATYPFWNNPDNTQATIRFLPDADLTNDFFWVERMMIKLPFVGVKGERDAKRTEVQVPCTNMWQDRSCVITSTISPWWNDDSLKDMARQYYRKKSYLFQGFVLSNPNKDDQSPENPIRRFIINTSIFDIIKAILMRADLEHSPTDYVHGRDFDLTKVTKAGYANYASSSWSMRERALTQDELLAIEQHKLFDLKSFLPAKPDDAHKQAIQEMFEASVDGELYDPERWGQYYRPQGFKLDSSSTPTGAAVAASTTVSSAAAILSKMNKTSESEPATVDADDEIDTTPPAVTAAVASDSNGDKKTPEQLLAMIRARRT